MQKQMSPAPVYFHQTFTLFSQKVIKRYNYRI